MRHFLFLVIRLYWAVVPAAWRRRCLFRVSCSRRVYAAAESGGTAKAVAVLFHRWRECRPGYRLDVDGCRLRLVLRDGCIVDESEIALWLLAPYRAGIAEVLKSVVDASDSCGICAQEEAVRR